METTPDAPQPPTQSADELLAYFKKQQNLLLGIGAGLAAAIVGAIIWAVVTVSSGYQIGWMAVGIGFLVGFSLRFGKGIDKVFGISGAILALFGCIFGNFLTLVGFISQEEKISIFSTLTNIDYSKVPELLISTASPMDFLFYAIAIYEGYKFSFRKISEEDLVLAKQKIEQGA